MLGCVRRDASAADERRRVAAFAKRAVALSIKGAVAGHALRGVDQKTHTPRSGDGHTFQKEANTKICSWKRH